MNHPYFVISLGKKEILCLVSHDLPVFLNYSLLNVLYKGFSFLSFIFSLFSLSFLFTTLSFSYAFSKECLNGFSCFRLCFFSLLLTTEIQILQGLRELVIPGQLLKRGHHELMKSNK